MKHLEKLLLRNKVLSQTFPSGNDPYQMMTRLLEEAGELAAQVHHFEGAGVKVQKHGSPNPQKLVQEIRDVLCSALQVAQHYDVVADLKTVIDERVCDRICGRRGLDLFQKKVQSKITKSASF